MQTLYITDNGLQLKKRSKRIAVKKGKQIIKEIHTGDLKRILVFGNSQITTELMRFLSGKGVEVAFLSSYGKLKYRLAPELTKNIYLRIAQHDRLRDPEFKLKISQAFVKAKIANQRIFLMRYQRNRPDVDLNEAVESLKTSIRQADSRTRAEQLRGVEGNASRIFFKAFGQLLLHGFELKKREYHPPPDPVNAMLGFAYMMVFNELSSMLEAFGFDSYIGFLHEIKYGRKSLASDLIEELRSPVAERLVLYLINKGVIKTDQFTKKDKGVIMDDTARKNFLANYENFMTSKFIDAKTEKYINFRQVIRERVEQLERAVINNEPYSPFILHA